MTVELISLQQIVEDPEQPRKRFDSEALTSLCDSIRQHGILQPISVKPLAHVNMFQIVTGERRWRAAGQAGLDSIPCVVVSDPGEETLTRQLVENLMREDLAPIEKAQALAEMKDRLSATNKEVGFRIGLSERTVGHLLELLELPEEIGLQVVASPNRPADGQLTEKHARSLRQLNELPDLQRAVVNKVRQHQLTGDHTSRLVKALRDNPGGADDLLASDPGEWEFIGGSARLRQTTSLDEEWTPPRDDSESDLAAQVYGFIGSLDSLQPDALPRSELRKLKDALSNLKIAVDGLIRECDLELAAER